MDQTRAKHTGAQCNQGRNQCRVAPEMAELRDVIGVQRKAQTAWPCWGMDKGCNAAMRVEDECKPSCQVWRNTRQCSTLSYAD